MPELLETSRAILGLRTDLERRAGLHISQTVMPSAAGIFVGEEPFDPRRHRVSDINPMSYTELATDSPIPYVALKIPYRPLAINVVVHDDSGNYQPPEWLRPVYSDRKNVAQAINGAVDSSKQPRDQIQLYVVGNPSEADQYSRKSQLIETTKPQEAAEEIAGICTSGLTFVISNFERLPFSTGQKSKFRRAVGIKVNHPLELALVAKTGIWPLGGTNEVNTNSKQKLKITNADLAAKQAKILAGLDEVGLPHVETVTDSSKQGYDARGLDRSLSNILRRWAGR